MIRSIFGSRVGLAALAAACVVAIAAPAASANPVHADTLTCQFAGVTILNPAIQAADPSLDGIYTLSGDAICVAVEVDDPTNGLPIQLAGPGTVHILSNGYFTNDHLVGNGNLAGVACLWTDPGSPFAEVGAVTCPPLQTTTPPTNAGLVDYYHFPGGATGNTRAGIGIDFIEGVGTLGGEAYGPSIEPTAPSLPPPLPPARANTGPDAYNLVGTVVITPTPGAVFNVNGAFVAES